MCSLFLSFHFFPLPQPTVNFDTDAFHPQTPIDKIADTTAVNVKMVPHSESAAILIMATTMKVKSKLLKGMAADECVAIKGNPGVIKQP
jgi:hypothetical protein